MSISPSARQVLAQRIAGEIILSSKPGVTMRKWRQLFVISQTRLSERMKLSPSVVSDYESGRRKSPGTRFVRRFVWALLAIDKDRGNRFAKEFAHLLTSPSAAILDIRELPLPVIAEHFCKAISAEVVACSERLGAEICGYTLVDSVKAMETLAGWEFLRIFGATTERALIFTNVEDEAFPMVSVRVSMLKPRMVVFQGSFPQELSIKLAEYDGILLAHSEAPTVEHLAKLLRRLYRVLLRRKMGRPVHNSVTRI